MGTKAYRLMLCRDDTKVEGPCKYVLFCGTENPTRMGDGLWHSMAADCRLVRVWHPKYFHELFAICMRRGAGPRVVTLEFKE